MGFHRFGGLVVASEIPFSQLPPSEGRSADCSVRLRALTPASREPWEHHWRRPDGSISLSCSRAGGVYRLGFPGLAEAEVSADGREVAIVPHASLPPETLEHLVIDQVLPRAASLQGHLVLHAACVVTESGACAFLGDSGSGKSTLCAGFVREGDALLGDDGIVVRRDHAGGFEAEATYPGLRLFPYPKAHLWDAGGEDAPVAHNSEKRRLAAGAPGAFPLRALYLLDAPGSAAAIDTVETSALTPREAFVALLRSTFQLHRDDPARARRLFETLSAVTEAVPVRSVRYARRLELLPEVRGEVLRDLSEVILPA